MTYFRITSTGAWYTTGTGVRMTFMVSDSNAFFQNTVLPQRSTRKGRNFPRAKVGASMWCRNKRKKRKWRCAVSTIIMLESSPWESFGTLISKRKTTYMTGYLTQLGRAVGTLLCGSFAKSTIRNCCQVKTGFRRVEFIQNSMPWACWMDHSIRYEILHNYIGLNFCFSLSDQQKCSVENFSLPVFAQRKKQKFSLVRICSISWQMEWSIQQAARLWLEYRGRGSLFNMSCLVQGLRCRSRTQT